MLCASFTQTLILWVLFKLNSFLKNLNLLHKCWLNHNRCAKSLSNPSDKHSLSCHSSEKNALDNPRSSSTFKWYIKFISARIVTDIQNIWININFKAFLTWLVFVGTKCQSWLRRGWPEREFSKMYFIAFLNIYD